MNCLEPTRSPQPGKAAITLRQKLLLTFLPIGLLPLVIAGGISGAFTYQRTAQQAELRLRNLAIITAELTSKDLDNKTTLLASLAANPLILESVRAGTQQAEIANLPNLPIPQVEAKFANRKELQPNRLIEDYLRDIARIGNFAEVFVTEKYGFNIAYSRPTSDFVQRDEQWWNNGKQLKHWIGVPEFDQSTQKVTIEIIHAIHDPASNKFMGVLKGGYDTSHLKYLKEELRNLQFHGSEQLQILAIGEPMTAIATINAQGISSIQEIPGKVGIRQQVQPLQKLSDHRFSPIYTGIRLATWSDGDRQYTLATIPQTNWVAVTSVKLAQIQADGYQLVSIFGLFFLGLGAVTTGVILRFSHKLSAPLNDLAELAQKVTEKADFTIQAEVSNQDSEVGVLAKSLNLLLQRVQQLLYEQAEAKHNLEIYNQTLEQKVQERTQELEVYSQTLEQKVHERTIALHEKTLDLEQTLHRLQQTQSQMIQAEKMSSLGQLVAGVAHEINNPVNFIHGNLTHVQEYAEDLLSFIQLYQAHYPHPTPEIATQAQAIDLEFLQEDLPKTLNSMRLGTERICQIVLSLRNFSRLDEAELKAVDLREGIDSTLLILQHRLKARPERPEILVVKEYGSLPLVECYPGPLNQVFMNLLVNAIDALEEKTVSRNYQEMQESPNRITIRTTIIAHQWVEITVTDNGIGMAETTRKRLFEPFFTTKPVGKGTGMGMPISHQIITEKHQGKLTCFSTIGEGTTFTIQIPVQQSLPQHHQTLVQPNLQVKVY
ncbi:sensor histidine kinase [Pantanalinema sp. GBBB05]|uniref:sensor histidine kinase n=1 Tax=Pantanalinema sp. GBBB05 TaxID=2604139 RepID=UPI001DC05EAE|nr:HAMP domain-containing protein [Pantanalinema sp. GBBB05]